MDAGTGRFVAAGRSIHVQSDTASTPLYLREGTLLPMQPGERTTQQSDLSEIELHVILGRGCGEEATLDYVFDDGLTDAHARGERGAVRLRVTRAGDELCVGVEVLQAWKPLRLRVVGYDGAASAEIALPGGTVSQALVADTWRFSGQPLAVARGGVVAI
jgi:alpha-glucosidase